MAREKTKEELEKEARIKSSVYERKRKNKNSKFIIVSVTLIVLGYVFFFLSPALFHEKPERYYTEIGTVVPFTGGNITPNSWVYAKSGKMMQVEFTFKSNQTLAPEIEVNAATSFNVRTKPSTKIDSEIIYHENDFYIANIYNVPDDYYCVSLRVKTKESKAQPQGTSYTNDRGGLGEQVIEQLNETVVPTDSEGNQEVTSSAVIYTCSDAVDTVYSLYRLDDYIYRIKRIQSNINGDYALVAQNDSSIESYTQSIEDLRIRNDELTDEMLYMTSTEKQANEREIENNNSSINEYNSKISNLQGTNDFLLNEISEYEGIIKRIAAENEGREYIEPTTEPSETPTMAPTVMPTQPPTEAPTQAGTQKPSQKSK